MSATGYASAPRLDSRRFFQWAGAAVLTALALYFVASSLLRYLDFTPKSYGRHWAHPQWLAMHIAGGTLALVLGPFQFSSRVRRDHLQLHRNMGRVYLGGILLGSITAFYLGSVSPRPAFGFSLIVMASAWLSCAALAYVSIRRGQVASHREWMIRSYVVTYGFVVFRVILKLKLLQAQGPDAAVVTAWVCWVAPLCATEVVLQWRRIVGPAKIPTDSRRVMLEGKKASGIGL